MASNRKGSSLSHASGDGNPRDDSLLEEIADVKKAKFVRFVEALVALRELQYDSGIGASIIDGAQRIVARNLPSNLLRAAAIVVDHAYGFPAGQGSFHAPAWVMAKQLLPESERGLLSCSGFRDEFSFEVSEVVVLLHDIAAYGLHAGMAGIIRDVPGNEDEKNSDDHTVEFGEPEESITVTITVPGKNLRRPRPGDLIEDYRL